MKNNLSVNVGENGSVVFSDRSGGARRLNHLHMEPPDKKIEQDGRSVARYRTEDRQTGNASRVIHFLLSLCLIFSILSCAATISGCTAAQKQMFKDGLVSVGDCSLHGTIGCVATSMGACTTPLTTFNKEDWTEYSQCLAARSASCSVKAIGLCAYRSIEGSVFPGGGVGCAQMQDEMEQCIADSRIETEAEAVQVVADCQRRVCAGN